MALFGPRSTVVQTFEAVVSCVPTCFVGHNALTFWNETTVDSNKSSESWWRTSSVGGPGEKHDRFGIDHKRFVDYCFGSLRAQRTTFVVVDHFSCSLLLSNVPGSVTSLVTQLPHDPHHHKTPKWYSAKVADNRLEQISKACAAKSGTSHWHER